MDELVQISYALDTFYLLVSGALVMWMAAGFSMLEAGLVRSKNTTEILTKNVALYAIACFMYMLFGYNIMYGDAVNSFIPGFDWLLGPEHTAQAVKASGGDIVYAKSSDFFFQVVFVATAMSIVSGAVAERMKLWTFLGFAVIMTGFIYPVQGYWKWGEGFLHQMGFQDFAGSGVVHLAGAAAALAGVLLLGPRKGKYQDNGAIVPIPGANLPLAALGTFILWLGWFGFNGGSQLAVSNIENANAVAKVFVNTNAAAVGGVIAALFLSRIMFKKIDLTMMLNGALAGLVAITAEPLAPSAGCATLVGMAGGVLVMLSIVFLDRKRIDDPVGAISVHGVVGLWGLIAVVFTNSDASLSGQLIGAATIFAWVFFVSLLVWWLFKITFGLRVSKEDEFSGLDVADCGLEAYPEFTESARK